MCLASPSCLGAGDRVAPFVLLAGHDRFCQLGEGNGYVGALGILAVVDLVDCGSKPAAGLCRIGPAVSCPRPSRPTSGNIPDATVICSNLVAQAFLPVR